MALVVEGRPVREGEPVQVLLCAVMGTHYQGAVLIRPTPCDGAYRGTTPDGALEVLDGPTGGCFLAEDVIGARRL